MVFSQFISPRDSCGPSVSHSGIPVLPDSPLDNPNDSSGVRLPGRTRVRLTTPRQWDYPRLSRPNTSLRFEHLPQVGLLYPQYSLKCFTSLYDSTWTIERPSTPHLFRHVTLLRQRKELRDNGGPEDILRQETFSTIVESGQVRNRKCRRRGTGNSRK